MNNVGKTVRLWNFLLDTVIYFVLVLLFFMTFNSVIGKEEVKWISILIYFLYYFTFELAWGQTLAKMITRTKVVTLAENKNYFYLQIMGRTLMRFLPFDIISYLFSPKGLHDWISKTGITKI